MEDKSVGRKRKDSSRKRSRQQTHDKEIKGDKAREETGESVAVTSEKVSAFSSFASHTWKDNNWFLGAFIFLLILLIILNIYLSYRVISLEHSTKSWETFDLTPSLKRDMPTNMDEFRSLLYRQQRIQSIQFKKWQHVLSTSMHFLQQVQNSLNELQQEVEKPLST